MYTGGDLIEVVITSATTGSLRLDPKGSEDADIDIGGYVNADSDDSVTGSGSNIVVKNRKRWSVPVPPCGWSLEPDTLIELQLKADEIAEQTFVFTFIDGAVFKGTGAIVGDIKGNKNAGLINSFKCSGGGKLERIA